VSRRVDAIAPPSFVGTGGAVASARLESTSQLPGGVVQFEVRLRNGATHTLEATYIEVTGGVVSTYTLLGPVPNYPIAILAAFPVDVVQWVCPIDANHEAELERVSVPSA
jgi:hypothetical protein